jgi:hypothetical protein
LPKRPVLQPGGARWEMTCIGSVLALCMDISGGWDLFGAAARAEGFGKGGFGCVCTLWTAVRGGFVRRFCTFLRAPRLVLPSLLERLRGSLGARRASLGGGCLSPLPTSAGFPGLGLQVTVMGHGICVQRAEMGGLARPDLESVWV